ncbi:hypothetical protein GCM10027612_08940 [Microbispora bryophytorum subsp. camponoti]
MFRDHAAPLRRDDGSGPPGRSPEPKERPGIHVNIRPEERKLCLLVMIGVCADGREELVALSDGYRESAEL